MPPRTLVQLISDQTMQNLLPIIALRPAKVFHICSSEPRYRQIAANIESATNVAGIDAEFRIVALAAPFPGLMETRYEIKQLLSIFPGAIVNITGGTKLMSLGAYLGAAEFDESPILYCDTHQRQFLSMAKRANFTAKAFDETVQALTVPIVLAAHGHPPHSWRHCQPTDAEMKFARIAGELRTKHISQLRTMNGRLTRHFKGGRKEVLDYVPPLKAENSAELAYFTAAAEAGILAAPSPDADLENAFSEQPATAPAAFHIPDQTRSKRTLLLLEGGWFEIFVLGILQSNPRFRDVRWSVEAVDGNAMGETDILCIDRSRSNLVLISCKSGLPQLEHFESLRHRADTFGGSHSQAFLCVFDHGPDKKAPDRCRVWAKSQRINLLLGSNEIHAGLAPTHIASTL